MASGKLCPGANRRRPLSVALIGTAEQNVWTGERALFWDYEGVHPLIQSRPVSSHARIKAACSVGQDDYYFFKRGITVRMPTPPFFFLPFLPPELAEASYARMAEKCDKIAPGPGRRVYSISFVHQSVIWVATVGKRL